MTDDEDAIYIHGRCTSPTCGHRLREDLPASACPECRTRFGPEVPDVYAERCDCDRCVGVRTGDIKWRDRTAPDPLGEECAAKAAEIEEYIRQVAMKQEPLSTVEKILVAYLGEALTRISKLEERSGG